MDRLKKKMFKPLLSLIVLTLYVLYVACDFTVSNVVFLVDIVADKSRKTIHH
jgi:hypothetical protein